MFWKDKLVLFDLSHSLGWPNEKKEWKEIYKVQSEQRFQLQQLLLISIYCTVLHTAAAEVPSRILRAKLLNTVRSYQDAS